MDGTRRPTLTVDSRSYQSTFSQLNRQSRLCAQAEDAYPAVDGKRLGRGSGSSERQGMEAARLPRLVLVHVRAKRTDMSIGARGGQSGLADTFERGGQVQQPVQQRGQNIAVSGRTPADFIAF
jgi:hypothetical protein